MERLIKVSNLCDKEILNEVSRKFKSDIEQFKDVMDTLTLLRDPSLEDK